MDEQQKLYNWSLEQAAARFMDELTQDQLQKLKSIDFPFAYYEEELDKLGFNWSKNNPNGKRMAND